MAAVSLREPRGDLSMSMDQLKAIAHICEKQLPPYARPRFIRVVEEFVYTSTFKQSKLKLKQEGYSLTAIASPVYYLDCKHNTYREMTKDIEEKINTGSIQM